jgi:hypothetical protein
VRAYAVAVGDKLPEAKFRWVAGSYTYSIRVQLVCSQQRVVWLSSQVETDTHSGASGQGHGVRLFGPTKVFCMELQQQALPSYGRDRRARGQGVSSSCCGAACSRCTSLDPAGQNVTARHVCLAFVEDH